jgi:two-component system NtrC family sensor kinase
MPEPDGGATSSSEGESSVALAALRNDERRAAMIRFASSLSHALGTPLNVIAGRAAMISMEELPAEEIAQNARIIEAQVRGITEMLQRALRFVREGVPAGERTDLSKLAERAVCVLQPSAASRKITLRCTTTAELMAVVPQNRILGIVTNLLCLGLDTVGDGGRISLDLQHGHAEPPPSERGRAVAGNCARFAIQYEGARLDDELFRRVYEPWLEPPASGRDAALLLAVAFGMAREHRAWVEARDSAEGTTLSLCWPLVSA